MRVVPGPRALLLVVAAIHLRHTLEKPSVDLIGVAVASFASWVGVPGPGEPVLIAAGISAAHHHVSIVEVVLVAWAAATAGGIAGWLAGIRAGRTVLTTRGPLRGLRRSALRRGDEIFARTPRTAILLTPSWVAGIHGVPSRLYNTFNVASAAVWAVGIGLGAYYAGPPIVDAVTDLGTVLLYGLIALIVVAVGGEVLRRRRRRRRRERGAEIGERGAETGGRGAETGRGGAETGR
jgi:membrane protein DedA with SNARE-associated domain